MIMNYCKNCLQTDTRPGIKFNKNGICPACTNYERLEIIDWDERRKELDDVVAFGKKNERLAILEQRLQVGKRESKM